MRPIKCVNYVMSEVDAERSECEQKIYIIKMCTLVGVGVGVKN